MYMLRIRIKVQREKLKAIRFAISRYENRRTAKMIQMQRIIGEVEETLYRCEKLAR